VATLTVNVKHSDGDPLETHVKTIDAANLVQESLKVLRDSYLPSVFVASAIATMSAELTDGQVLIAKFEWKAGANFDGTSGTWKQISVAPPEVTSGGTNWFSRNWKYVLGGAAVLSLGVTVLVFCKKRK
jgi:hypothetical protein